MRDAIAEIEALMEFELMAEAEASRIVERLIVAIWLVMRRSCDPHTGQEEEL